MTLTAMKRQESPIRGSGSDEDSYTSCSRSGSGTASTLGSKTDPQSLAQHVEPSSPGQHTQSVLEIQKPSVSRTLAGRRQNDGNEQEITVQPFHRPTPILGPEESQVTRSADLEGPLGHCPSPPEQESVADRSNVIRRLSQSLLALSSNTLTRITDEDSPRVSSHIATRQIADAAASGSKVTGTSPGAAIERYEPEEEEPSRNDAPARAQQSSTYRGQTLTQDPERPDGKQARLQLEDMLTRIELHFQAEKSARLEAEARCAAALEALRRAGHPEGAPLTLPAPRQLPESFTDRARECITAARSLVASVCAILEEIEIVRENAHNIQATMDSLLQELPGTSDGLDMTQGYDNMKADSPVAVGTAQSQAMQPGGYCDLEQPGIAPVNHIPVHSLKGRSQPNGEMGRAAEGRLASADGLPVRSGRLPHPTSTSIRGPVKSRSPGRRGGQQQGSFLNSTQGQRQRAAIPEMGAGLLREVSPQRKQPDQPQRWETSTKFVKAVR